MTTLNASVGDTTCVWCDGRHYDVHWLTTLARAACVTQTFKLCDLSTALKSDTGLRDSYLDILKRTAPPHRAGPDAVRICGALTSVIAG